MGVFVVVNEAEKAKFEKKYFLPFGYHTCPIFSFEEAAIGYVEKQPARVRNNLVVYKNECGDLVEVYRGEWYDPFLDIIDLQ